MDKKRRPSLQELRILAILSSNPDSELYGFEIMREAQLPSGSVYPILARLEAKGHVSSLWENVDKKIVKRNRRRFYRITNKGLEYARENLERERKMLNFIVGGAST